MNAPRISLVIPAFNEARYLPRLLDSVDIARERFAAKGGAVEVIVADNMSTDATARIAAERGCVVARIEKRAIAAARNGGAAAATGEIVAFVDADSVIHRDTFIAVDEAMRNPAVAGGSTGCTLERWSVPLVAVFAFLSVFVWVTGMDTGVVFVRRADFERLGGYDESLKVAEDVKWLWTLKRDGRTRGQKLVRLRHVKVIGSTRKFDAHGDWHYFGFFAQLPGFVLRKGALTEFQDRYWYKPDR